jgi:hypothetical protein
MRFLFIVLLAFTLVRIGTSCDSTGQTESSDAARLEDDMNTSESTVDGNAADPTALGAGGLQPRQYDEIKSARIGVTGNDQVTIYSLPGELMFTPENGEISLEVKQELKQIANSIKKRFPQGRVYLYSHGSAEAGEPEQKRAVEVKNWLVVQEHLDQASVFLPQTGESPSQLPDLQATEADGSFRIVAVQP